MNEINELKCPVTGELCKAHVCIYFEDNDFYYKCNYCEPPMIWEGKDDT